MSPFLLLGMVTGVTALAGVAQGISRRAREEQLRALAQKWKMNYSPRDQWRLTPKIARNFPVPGAAHIKLTDLIYGSDAQSYRYIFTTEYTTGVVLGKRRISRVGSYTEPRERLASDRAPSVILAPLELDLLRQYQSFEPPRVIIQSAEVAQ